MKRLDLQKMKTKDMQDLTAAVKVACACLTAGDLLIYPTETTYGIGVDATNQEAVLKLLRYKARREGKPLSIAVTDEKMAALYVSINEEAHKLYQNFLPGPITVISAVKKREAKPLATGIASERATVGVRIPKHPLILEIIKAYGKPITATSANASYKKRPYNVSDILENISDRQKKLIGLILDAGQLPRNEPSTVVDTTRTQPTVLRQGDIKLSKATTTITQSEKETRCLGSSLASQYLHCLAEKSLIFALVGEMGAGKTQFTKGIAEKLTIDKQITSPTYAIAAEYIFKSHTLTKKLIHIDTWRLSEEKELENIGFTSMVDSLNVIAIEWADKFANTLTLYADEAKIIWVKLAYGKTPNERIITYSDHAE